MNFSVIQRVLLSESDIAILQCAMSQLPLSDLEMVLSLEQNRQGKNTQIAKAKELCKKKKISSNQRSLVNRIVMEECSLFPLYQLSQRLPNKWSEDAWLEMYQYIKAYCNALKLAK